MKSKVKFDIDEHGHSFLSLTIVNDFEDLRDKAANGFVQGLHGGTDLKVKCTHNTKNLDGTPVSVWEIHLPQNFSLEDNSETLSLQDAIDKYSDKTFPYKK